MADGSPQNEWGNWNLSFGISVPLIRYDKYEIGQIIEMIRMPCLPTPTIIVKTAGPALLKALVSIAEPDLKELYSWGHGPSPGNKHGRSLLKGIKSIVEPILEKSPLFSDGAGKFIFQIAEVADRLSWYLFLLSVGTEFAYDWSTAAYSKAGCIDQPPYFWSSSQPLGPVWVVGQTIPEEVSWLGTGTEGPGVYSTVMDVPPGKAWYAGMTIQLTGYIANPPRPYTIIVYNETTGQNQEVSIPFTWSDGATNSPIAATVMQAPHPEAQRIRVGPVVGGDSAWDTALGPGYCYMGHM